MAEEGTNPKRTFTYERVASDRISARDLSDTIAGLRLGQTPCEAYRVTIWDEGAAAPHAEQAQALYIAREQRLGIVWGADATWASVPSVGQGIALWLNSPEEWERRA